MNEVLILETKKHKMEVKKWDNLQHKNITVSSDGFTQEKGKSQRFHKNSSLWYIYFSTLPLLCSAWYMSGNSMYKC